MSSYPFKKKGICKYAYVIGKKKQKKFFKIPEHFIHLKFQDTQNFYYYYLCKMRKNLIYSMLKTKYTYNKNFRFCCCLL